MGRLRALEQVRLRRMEQVWRRRMEQVWRRLWQLRRLGQPVLLIPKSANHTQP